MQIGVMFGNPETTPGGKALNFTHRFESISAALLKLKKVKKLSVVVSESKLSKIKSLPHSAKLNLISSTMKAFLKKVK
jgi:RecA/RadA recombinase